MPNSQKTQGIAVPPGWMKNALGHLVPEDQVRPHDKLRDHTARELAGKALALSQALAEFKQAALADLADLVAISAERYQVTIGGEKGNVSITSYDGEFKVERAVADRITFTEEILAAKAKIDQCIRTWSKGANDNLQVLVDRAFRANSKGQIKTTDVLDLLRVEIKDPDWKLAMKALRDSIQITGTSVYVRVYQREPGTDRYLPVSLNIAGV